MFDTNINNEIKLYDEFLDKWSVEKMRNLSLHNYSNLDKNSFTYDIEFEMRHLGSIKGGVLLNLVFIEEKIKLSEKVKMEKFILMIMLGIKNMDRKKRKFLIM